MTDKLLWGVKNGELETVEEVLKQKNISVNAELQGGRNALHFAADYGQTKVIESLLDAGADINMPDKHGITPLLAAIWENHTDAVKLLLTRGANKNGVSPDGQNYIDCADTDDMKMLLQQK